MLRCLAWTQFSSRFSWKGLLIGVSKMRGDRSRNSIKVANMKVERKLLVYEWLEDEMLEFTLGGLSRLGLCLSKVV